MNDSQQVVVTACSDSNLLLWPSKQDFCAGSADTCQKKEGKCFFFFFFPQRVLSELPLYYLRSGGICASQCIFWESRVGKFVYWASFKTFTLQNCVFSRQPQFSKTGDWLVGPNTLFNMLFCTIPAGHDQAFNLQYICPLAHCKAEARFNAQQ